MLREIVLAGLLHDIGKFAERGAPDEYEHLGQDHTYKYNHATASARFLDTMIKGNSAGDKRWINHAVYHHNPSDNEPLQWIIAEADRLSSGMDRQAYDQEEKPPGSLKHGTALKPIFEFIDIKNMLEPTEGKYFYPLKKFELSEEVIMPALRPPGLDLSEDYRTLFRDFKAEFAELVAYHPAEKVETLYYLLKKYLWAVPASVRKSDFPDVSLFEHLKTTAALAACLFVYHDQNKTLDKIEAIKNRRENKFLLFSGDVGGIQRFIYQVSSKGAYAQLKGRSFYIQIINDLIAEHLLEATGLMLPNLIYSSGGKFYLLLPNTGQINSRLNDSVKTINRELFDKFDGELFLRTARAELSGEDLHLSTGKLSQKWKLVNTRLQEANRNKFDFLITDQEGGFNHVFQPYGVDEPELCESCFREIPQTNQTPKLCPVCKKMGDIGKRLRNANYLVISPREQDKNGDDVFLNKSLYIREDIQKLFNGDAVYLLNSTDYTSLLQQEDYRRHKSREILAQAERLSLKIGFKFYGGNRKFDVSFDQIAQRATGNFKKLGILRMDVDNLGSIFAEGLHHYKVKPKPEYRKKHKQEANFYSISRMTTLSFEMSCFFAGYLNNIVANYRDAEGNPTAAIVYSGGDDMFILGAWDTVVEIGREIRQKFKRFTCENPNFTISGGVAITDGKFPIYKSADYAGEAEERAKNHQRGNRKKDSLHLFGHTLFWRDLEELYQLQNTLLAIIGNSRSNRSLIHQLERIYFEYVNVLRSLRRKEMSLADIERIARNERWVWRMVYNLKRYGERNPDLKKDIEDIKKKILGKYPASGEDFILHLPVASYWADLLTR